jgi:hypothetical protein
MIPRILRLPFFAEQKLSSALDVRPLIQNFAARRDAYSAFSSSAAPSASVSESLSGKIALVQGASRGLGLEYVRQLLQFPGTKYLYY